MQEMLYDCNTISSIDFCLNFIAKKSNNGKVKKNEKVIKGQCHLGSFRKNKCHFEL